ncbi:hydrogenase small subunit [Sulfurivermis fontis]|uniref:hydrogenase small subunit n=1 Tax=Sulfurivermis fontis TaxID=1972068 RepID=UPI000FD9D5BE|nr:hydrogenase small subunit [Sulfurivermis fontis]
MASPRTPRLSRRAFLKFCAQAAALLALPPGAARLMAAALARTPRLPLVWLSFQECTGCTEALTRSEAPSLERLLFEIISLDYHHTLQAAAGAAAEAARERTLKEHAGRLLLVVDGSVPTALHGACSTIAGESNLSLLGRCLEAAEAVVAVGTCAAFGGLPAAAPNPTGAMGVADLMAQGKVPLRPLVNLPGCPPVPEVISAVLAHRVAFGHLPELDDRARPLALYGETVHERCSRRGHYEAGRFAKQFDDEGARAGWCLYELGCKGITTYNACATRKWNGGTSTPIESGHPCLGCAEPGFWDHGSFYAQPTPAASGATRAEQGRALYEGNCVYCHDADPTRLRTLPDQVAELLRGNSVRAHRFKLGEDDLAALTEYLKEAKP